MGCSSVGEKNKDESGGGKLKESLLNTLDKTLLLIRNICSKSSGGKPLNSSGKTGESPLENLVKK